MNASLPIDSGLLRRVLAGLPDFILVVDRDGTILYINRVEPGYDPDEVVGMKSADVLFPDSREVFQGALDKVFEAGDVAPFEVRAQHPDGSKGWYGGEVAPLSDEGGMVAAVIRANDITELKATQEELAQVRQLFRMCAWCGRIQREDGEFESVSAYLARRDDTDVSHGLCPECEAKQFGSGVGA